MTTFTDKIMALLRGRKTTDEVARGDDKDDQPMTTAEILEQRTRRDALYRVQSAFEESMWRILSCSKGKDQIDKLKRTVEEFGSAMDTAFAGSNMDVKRIDAEVEQFGRSLTEVAEVLAASQDSEELSQEHVERIERVLDTKHKPSDMPEAHNKEKETMTTAKKPTLDEVLRKLSPEERAVLDEHKKDEQKTPEEVVRTAAATADPATKTAMEDVLRKLDERDVSIKSLSDRLSKIEEEKTAITFERKADEYKALGLPKDELIATLRSGGEAAVKLLDAAKAKVESVNKLLTSEIGTSEGVSRGQESTVINEITRKASELLTKDADNKFAGSLAKARNEVRRAHPDLAQRERDELSS